VWKREKESWRNSGWQRWGGDGPGEAEGRKSKRPQRDTALRPLANPPNT